MPEPPKMASTRNAIRTSAGSRSKWLPRPDATPPSIRSDERTRRRVGVGWGSWGVMPMMVPSRGPAHHWRWPLRVRAPARRMGQRRTAYGGGMRKLPLLTLMLLVAAIGPGAAAASAASKSYDLSLGDSLATGYQKTATGAVVYSKSDYTHLLYKRAAKSTKHLKLVA